MKKVKTWVLGIPLALAIWAGAISAVGAEKTLTLSGVPVTVQDISGEVDVFFTSMRLNRAMDVWNVEVTIRNRGTRVLNGPFALYVESFTGTTGLVQPDGLDGANGYADLGNNVPGGSLATNQSSTARTLTLGRTASGSPQLNVRVYGHPEPAGYALGLSRSLNEVGQPLPGVTVEESGSGGASTNQTDAALGIITLGKSTGEHLWKFAKLGYLPSWRRGILSSNEVTLVPNPRLQARGTNVATFTPIAGGSLSATGIVIRFGPGAFSQNATGTLTRLTGQTLPGFLPYGWSPLQAFCFEVGETPSLPATASVTPWSRLALSETAAVVQWNETQARWNVMETVTGGTNVSFSVPGEGTFAVVVPDTGVFSPPAAVAGQPLEGTTAPFSLESGLSALGTVTPALSPASRNAELVTAAAEVTITNASGPLPSGVVLRCEVLETYDLSDDTRRMLPRYETFIVAYQRPGDADPNTVVSHFPMRPMLLLGGDELKQGNVRVDVLRPGAFGGGVFDERGGQVAVGGVRILAAAGVFTNRLAIDLSLVDATNFTAIAGSNIVQAFELSVGALPEGKRLVTQFAPQTPNSFFVLGRVQARDGLFGVEPIERFASDATGKLTSVEPGTGERLPGLTSGGQFVLVRVPGPLGLIHGIARNISGQAVAGLPLRVTGQKWMVFSQVGGAYRLIAPTGSVEVVLSDPASGDSTPAAVLLTDWQAGAVLNITAVAAGPRVVLISPANNATNVPLVSAVTITFSEPVNVGSAIGNIVLLGLSNAPVNASLQFNLRGNIATLLPTEALAAETVHQLWLGTNIADLAGYRLEGTNVFLFRTQSERLERGLGAQLTSHEPTNGVVYVHSTQGMAEPGQPVILVNDSTGYTMTVLAKTDGSFDGHIPATVDDLVSAVFVNQNGTRNTVPMSRQVFADGSVGLFNGGGTIEATIPEGTVEVIVEPGAISGKSILKVEALSRTNLATWVTNVPPDAPKALGGLKVSLKGNELRQSLDVSFPVNVADLGLPVGMDPTNASYCLAIPRQVPDAETGETNTVYEIVDRMHYENGKLVTHSPPFFGILPLFNLEIFTVPLVMTAGQLMTISGRVYAAEMNGDRPIPGTERFLFGAIVRAVPPGTPQGIPGRLRPGTVMATSGGTNGNYAMMVLVTESGGAAVQATHPRFPGAAAVGFVPAMSQAERFSLGNFFRPVDVAFPVREALDLSAPTIHFSHAPERPQPGTNGAVRVVATDNASRPSLTVSIAGAISLDAGTNIPPDDISLVMTNTEDVGSFTRREAWEVSAPVAARVLVQARAVDESGNENTSAYAVFFGGAEPVATNSIPAPDPNDTTGPRVLSSVPSRGGLAVAPGQPIVLRFDEPIDRAIVQDPTIISLMPGNLRGAARVSEDQLELTLTFPGIQPDKTYTLTVNSGVRDLTGNRLDQEPTIEGNNSFVLTFKTAELPSGDLPGMSVGGGAVIRGIYAYVLERSSPNAAVVVYDLSNPAAPVKRTQFLMAGGYPRDLVLIPDYAFKTNRTDSPVISKDLLAVVGGLTGVGRSQYLRILDISDPGNPEMFVAHALSLNPEALVSRLQWSAPSLGYLEHGSVNSIGILDLQQLILFEFMSQEEFKTMPEAGYPGVDANGDGDYVDPGDELPLPARFSGEFAGKTYAFTLPDSNAWLEDFVMGQGGQFVGVVADQGRKYGTNGVPTEEVIPPMYRTLFKAGGFPEPGVASYFFPDARPRWVSGLFQFPMVDNGQVRLADLVLVSKRMNTGFEQGRTNRLVVLEVTEPSDPQLVAEIAFPAELNGALNRVQSREDGMLMVSTDKDVLLLDPTKLRQQVGPDGLHPSIIGIVPNAGGFMRTFDGQLNGLNIVTDSGRNVVLQSAPTLQFVYFATNAPFLPSTVVDAPRTNLQRLAEQMVPANELWLARYRAETGLVASTLSPPLSIGHYYVLVHAPGSAGATLDLALESLNWAGQPMRKLGYLFPPVHALSPSTVAGLDQTPAAEEAPVRASRAWRLSSDPASPYYNLYLSRPFALIGEEISLQELADLEATVERDILWSGAYLRASLDPSMNANPVIGRYVGKVSREDGVHYPGVEVLAYSFPADYIQSPNPGPVLNGMTLTDALGAVGAHNGELRSETTDLVLPGRRLPIEFKRCNGAQGIYNGPFGRGWEFNYNQRVVELSGRGMSPGAKLPQVVRDTPEDSEIAENRDLLFHTGAGRIVIWKHAGTNAPPEIASDPLVQHLGWIPKTARFYLPPPGVFSLMFKFKDGRYVRLEPDGTQHWYNSAGRLTKIYDRYDKNSIELVYNTRGELIRIFDELRRPIEVGWWRLPTDPERRPGIDETTIRPAIAGKICRLQDYSRRDVLFYYTEDGLLERREGPQVETASVNSFTGRPITRYIYSDTTEPGRTGKSLKGIIGGDANATPLVAATGLGERGRDTVQKLKLATGELKVELGQQNTARAVAAGNATAKVTNPDRSTTNYKFDKFGRPSETLLMGDGGIAPQKTVTEYYTNGLIKSVTQPEGNSVEYEYDFANPSLRSRANVKKVTKRPGARGGTVMTATTEYDDWYNLPSGPKTDFRGIEAFITLRLDRRDTERVTKDGKIETFSANEFGQIEKHVAIDGITREWGFNADGFLQSTKVGTLETRYSYAPATGARSDFTLRGLASAVTDPRNIVSQFIYDERNQLVRSSRAGQETTYAYDESGNVVEVRSTVDTDKTLIETRTYDQVGFMTSKTLKAVEVDGVATDITTTFEPDAMRRVKRAVFPGNEIHELEYDHSGQLTNYVIGGTYKETYTYDGNGNQTSVTIGGATESRVYDGHDRVLQIITPNGTTNVFSYDGNNNLTGKAAYDRQGKLLSRLTAVFDDLDRVQTETRVRDNGTSTASYVYDSANRRRVFTDALGATLETFYDDAGRIWKEVSPTRTVEKEFDGNSNLRKRTVREDGRTYVEQFEYNDRDQMVSSHDNLGRPTIYDLGMDGRVKEVQNRGGFKYQQTFTILGEQATTLDPNSVLTGFDYSVHRQVSAIRDTVNNRMRTEYDTMGRVKRVVLPNNAETLYGDFDAHNTPRSITLPRGIQIQARYDAEGLLTNRVFASSFGPRAEEYVYDGLQRLQSVRDPSGSVSFIFDAMGFKKTFNHRYTFKAPGATPATLDFNVGQEADNGGFRSKVIYPDGAVSIVNERDITGRLRALMPDSGEVIMRSTAYLGDALVRQREIGNGRIQLTSEYDALKRPTMRRYVNMTSGRILADVRYAYDANGAQLARQFIHRGGRADFFQYDDGYRLKRADMQVRPALGGAEAARTFPGFTTPPGVPGTWTAGEFARELAYTLTDVLQGAGVINPDSISIPPMAATFGAPDALLFVPSIDGFTRERDDVGNVIRTRLWVRIPGNATPVAVTAVNTFNELNQLVRIERDDGVVIENEYGPSGLRIRRKVSGDAGRCVPSDTAFLYDGGNMIEERDLTRSGAVVARYYYGDSADELIAGDLAAGGTNLARHYFVSDVVQSVLGVANADGNLVERIWYDAWGQPNIEAADSAAPQISRVLFETNSLLVEFTEGVLPVFASGASSTNVVGELGPVAGIFEITAGGGAVNGTILYQENIPGRPFGSAFRFIAGQNLSGSVELRLNGGTLQDEANNTNAAVTLNLNLAVPGVVFTGPAAGSTAPAQLARSSVGSPFLFHGQVFDYDSGLMYCRARYYDPASGMFLSRDPSGYVDGVNQYAGFANNPISLRDPTGTATPEGMDNGEEAGKDTVAETGPSQSNGFVSTVLNLGTGAAEGWDLLHSGNPGSQGALDAMRGAELILNDAQTAAAAFGVMQLGASSAIGLTRRAAGFMNKFRSSPQIPAAVREHLIKSGLTQIEIDAIIPAMKKHGITRMSIRSFGEKRFARQLGVKQGLPQKPIHIKDKTGHLSTITEDGVTYVSDADILHMEIKGRPATLKEVQQFVKSANRNYTKLWNERGLGTLGVPANPPFQHGSHLSMAQMFERHGKIDQHYIRAVGHPGESFTIRIGSKGNITAFDTPNWMTHRDILRMGGILRNKANKQGLQPLSFPGGTGWPGRNWDMFRKDWVDEQLKQFVDPVTREVDGSRVRWFFNAR